MCSQLAAALQGKATLVTEEASASPAGAELSTHIILEAADPALSVSTFPSSAGNGFTSEAPAFTSDSGWTNEVEQVGT